MGIIIGKFRKKKSTFEILEKLEEQITSIEEFGRSTEQFRKKIIGRFVLLAVLFYLLLALFLFYYYNKLSSDRRLIYFIPIFAFPIIVWIIKSFMTWYYSRKIQRNEKKLIKLRDEKKKILDNVMETETYKVAKKILDKFGNEPTKVPQLTLSGSTPVTSKDKSMVPTTMRPSQTVLRQRIVGPQNVKGRLSFGSSVGPATPYPERTFIQPAMSAARPAIQYQGTPMQTFGNQATPLRVSGTALALPRSILPKDRTVLDKMIHFLIGDGPSNRFALICQKCSAHNGMAFKEDFEYLSYRCCYCSHFNPSRKQRPTGPALETTKATTESISDSDKETIESDEEQATTQLRSESPDAERNSDFDKLSDIDPKEMEVESSAKRIEFEPSAEGKGLESSAERKELEPSEHVGEGSGDGQDLNPFSEDIDRTNIAADAGSVDSPMEIDAGDSSVEAPTENLTEA
ncbi:endoplasmic reticulum junction formation protein lunapark-B [Leptinotarsa decemlineata]|uniref:endoplasmic reticulum junction formation protein lunapark-B n=1 Tax=Leptinotarsa decemlineata TaxID=7539 RepID=UPI003D309FAE